MPALAWLGGEGNDPKASAEGRAERLVSANQGILRDFGIEAHPARRRGEPGLYMRTQTKVGALPLVSPISGRPDFGVVIRPRFAWSSAGEMLAGTGFRVVPELLPLPCPPHSERQVPPWVLSSVVLTRLRSLLDAMQRRFALRTEDTRAPRGQVDWARYACTRLAVGRALEVPSTFPDLRDDDELKAAMLWVVRRHRASLLEQPVGGAIVRRLLVLCDELVTRLAGVVARPPGGTLRRVWTQRPLTPRVFREGLQAIDWTLDARGLAGMSDLAGLPWRMDMEVFFEAWVEAIASQAARRAGATLRVGRCNETRISVDWDPPHTGSQRALVPDLVLQRPDVVLVLDAKYKRHAEDIERLGWAATPETLREQHRHDVLQALAYASLYEAPRVVACLVYPADAMRWQDMVARGRALSRATLRTGARVVELALLAVPLSGDAGGAAEAMERLFAAA